MLFQAMLFQESYVLLLLLAILAPRPRESTAADAL
jgi:hypothetical protein